MQGSTAEYQVIFAAISLILRQKLLNKIEISNRVMPEKRHRKKAVE